MVNRQAKIPAEGLAALEQYDRSINHWSKQIGKALIQIDDMKSTLRTLYLARQKVISDAYEAAGIDPDKVRHVDLRDGILHAAVDESPAGTDA